MKKIFTLMLLIHFGNLQAQRFYATVFDQLPQDYQLYPRNDKGNGMVPISGKIEIAGWKYCSVQVFRNNVLTTYQRANLTYAGDIGSFQFSNVPIKAELAEYSFKVFAMNNSGDSTLVVNREHVVAGDAIVIGGQSNALSLVYDNITPYNNQFARTYGAGYPYEIPMKWALSEYGNLRVGQIGGWIQRYIIEKYKIPVCIINQAIGGINLGQSLIRDANNVGSLDNNYGITYNRIQNAGLLDGGVKAFIWRQGENESSGGAGFWGGLFDQLYKYWQQDYPKINKYYIFQVGLIAYPERNAGALRDYQRRTNTIYNNVDNIACVGTKGYDGIHYDSSGYHQTATELFRMIDRDLYGGKYTENVNSPNIQKAYFSKKDKKEITLEFEADQKMIWVEDTVLISKTGQAIKQYMRNMFFFNDNTESNLVVDGRAVDNKIVLSLSSAPATTTFNYLPAYHDDAVFKQFGGPFLTNKIGMRAFSFDGVTIQDYKDPITPKLATPLLVANNVSFQSINISWKTVPNTLYYILERKGSLTDSYKKIATLQTGTESYLDVQLADNQTYYYRIIAIGNNNESDYGFVEAQTIAKLTIPNLNVNTVSFNVLKLTWKAVTNATTYVLERKLTQNEAFKGLKQLSANTTEYTDSLLNDNTLYYYRIKAMGDKTESDFASAQASTIQKLAVSDLTVNSISFQSLKITWKPVTNATSYTLERKANINDPYKEVVKLKTNTFEYVDSLLKDNTLYYYRIKAFGDKTESDFATAQASTIKKLSIPEITISTISFQSLKISWKEITDAKSFTLERKVGTNDSYKELIKLTPTTLEYLDNNLKDNTLYYYRFKALGDKTESDYALAQGSTALLLSNQTEIDKQFNVFPNPTNTDISIRFEQPTSGNLTLMNISGSTINEIEIKAKSEMTLPLKDINKGIYFLKFQNDKEILVKKIIIE